MDLSHLWPPNKNKNGFSLVLGGSPCLCPGKEKGFCLELYIYIFFPFFLSLFGRFLFYSFSSVPKRLEEESFANLNDLQSPDWQAFPSDKVNDVGKVKCTYKDINLA
jgi:hypothetical protein